MGTPEGRQLSASDDCWFMMVYVCSCTDLCQHILWCELSMQRENSGHLRDCDGRFWGDMYHV